MIVVEKEGYLDYISKLRKEKKESTVKGKMFA